MERDLNVDDFMSGLVAALAVSGQRVTSIRGIDFYARMSRVFRALQERKDTYGVNVRFWIGQDRLHGDSPVVREAITSAVKRDLVSLDNPEYQDMRVKLTPEIADRILARLPGGRPLFEELAHVFQEGLPVQSK